MSAIKDIIERYLLLWLIVLSVLAFHWDRFGLVDPFTASRAYLPLLIAITMFAIGWMLPTHEVQLVWQRWPTVLGGTAVQYLAMPGLAYGLARLFQLEETMFLGVIMVGCVPGAMASNVLTLLSGGNTSYSVSLTTLATLLSPIAVPVALHLTLGETVSRQIIVAAAWQLCWMVVLPVITGHWLSRWVPRYQSLAANAGSIVANLTILWIVAYVVADNRQQLSSIGATVCITLALLNLLGYLAGHLGGRLLRLPEGMARALTLEVGMQNAGLGTALVLSLFADDRVAIPPAMYTFGCMLTGTILARLWRRWPVPPVSDAAAA